MKKRMQIPLMGFLLLALGLQQCSKKSKCQYVSPPSSFFFLVKKEGNRLPDEVLDNTHISYMENGVKKQLSDLVRATGEGRDLGILTTRLIGLLSADQQIRTFYIEYPAYPTDTLYLEYAAPTPSNNCLYTQHAVKYNGQVAIPDPSITVQQVYIFNK